MVPVISHCDACNFYLNGNRSEGSIQIARAAAKARKVKIDDDDGQVTEMV